MGHGQDQYEIFASQSTATSYSFNKNTPPTADDDDCDGGDIGECEPSLGSNIQRLLESSLAHPHTLNGVTRKQGDKYYMRQLVRSLNLPGQDDLSKLYREHFLVNFHDLHAVDEGNKNLIGVDGSRSSSKTKKVILPPTKHARTLVLDLDETLVHCEMDYEHCSPPVDVVIEIKLSEKTAKTGIYLRPGVMSFLREMSKLYQIVVFTASRRNYATAVVEYLDPSRQYVSAVLSRESCMKINGFYVKDLRVLADRQLSDLMIVDNFSSGFARQIDNGIPIIPFHDDQRDDQLQQLAEFLRDLHDEQEEDEDGDVRRYLRRFFCMQEYINQETPAELAQTLVAASPS